MKLCINASDEILAMVSEAGIKTTSSNYDAAINIIETSENIETVAQISGRGDDLASKFGNVVKYPNMIGEDYHSFLRSAEKEGTIAIIIRTDDASRIIDILGTIASSNEETPAHPTKKPRRAKK